MSVRSTLSGAPTIGDPVAGPPVQVPLRRAIIGTVILVAVAAISVLFLPPVPAGGLMIFVALVLLGRRVVFSWTGWLGILVAVIMFIPVRRYALPIPLPFQLEAYRVVLVVMIIAMTVTIVVGRTRPWQSIAFGWPIGILFASQIVSIPFNGTSLVEQALASNALGAIIGWMLALSVLFIVRQILSTETIVMALMTALVWCAVVVAFLAVVERVTRINVFWRLQTFLPLNPIATETEAFRPGGFRSFASSQHPIALSVLFCILIPVAIYLARYGRWPRNEVTRRIVYSLAILMLLCGVIVAVSRTAVVVLGVMFLVTLIFRPWLATLLVALGLPLLAVGTAVLPKVFDTLIGSFFDIDGLIASQQTSPGFRGAGRVADLGPSMEQAVRQPFFGTGLGSRIVTGDSQNAYILDNQVLGTLLESGAVGVFGLAVFLLAPAIMMLVWSMTTARNDPRYAFLAFALTISAAGYTAAMFFFDAFGFLQTFYVYFMLLAIGGWLLTASPPALAARARADRMFVRMPRATTPTFAPMESARTEVPA